MAVAQALAIVVPEEAVPVAVMVLAEEGETVREVVVDPAGAVPGVIVHKGLCNNYLP